MQEAAPTAVQLQLQVSSYRQQLLGTASAISTYGQLPSVAQFQELTAPWLNAASSVSPTSNGMFLLQRVQNDTAAVTEFYDGLEHRFRGHSLPPSAFEYRNVGAESVTNQAQLYIVSDSVPVVNQGLIGSDVRCFVLLVHMPCPFRYCVDGVCTGPMLLLLLLLFTAAWQRPHDAPSCVGHARSGRSGLRCPSCHSDSPHASV